MLRRFGFCEMWIGWIRACIFGGNLSVLVNGSPTREINIQTGAKTRRSVSTFSLFVGGGRLWRGNVEGGKSWYVQRVSI
jgi:hypothetical protein